LVNWAALKQLSENENDAMRVVLVRLMKQKLQHAACCAVQGVRTL